jgi:hypothetical protein
MSDYVKPIEGRSVSIKKVEFSDFVDVFGIEIVDKTSGIVLRTTFDTIERFVAKAKELGDPVQVSTDGHTPYFSMEKL